MTSGAPANYGGPILLPPSAKFVIVATGNYIYSSSCHDERIVNKKKNFLKHQIISNPLMELRRKNTKTKGRQGLQEARKGEGPAQPTKGASNTSAQESTGPANEGGPIFEHTVLLPTVLLLFYVHFPYEPLSSPPMTRLHD